MTWIDRIALFTPLDMVALGLLVASWLLLGWRIEHPGAKHPSTALLMAEYRREWMRQMVTRQPRVFDASIIANLRQGTSFLASTSVIAIGGTLAVIGSAERLAGLAEDLTLLHAPVFVWQAKLVVVVLFLTNAFLKYIWASRLFGYSAVIMAAVPNDPRDPLCMPRAMQSAEISIYAARSFNRGLRATYFALACAAWLAGPVPLMLATLFTVGVIWRREFASESRSILLGTQT